MSEKLEKVSEEEVLSIPESIDLTKMFDENDDLDRAFLQDLLDNSTTLDKFFWEEIKSKLENRLSRLQNISRIRNTNENKINDLIQRFKEKIGDFELDLESKTKEYEEHQRYEVKLLQEIERINDEVEKEAKKSEENGYSTPLKEIKVNNKDEEESDDSFDGGCGKYYSYEGSSCDCDDCIDKENVIFNKSLTDNEDNSNSDFSKTEKSEDNLNTIEEKSEECGTEDEILGTQDEHRIEKIIQSNLEFYTQGEEIILEEDSCYETDGSFSEVMMKTRDYDNPKNFFEKTSRTEETQCTVYDAIEIKSINEYKIDKDNLKSLPSPLSSTTKEQEGQLTAEATRDSFERNSVEEKMEEYLNALIEKQSVSSENLEEESYEILILYYDYLKNEIERCKIESKKISNEDDYRKKMKKRADKLQVKLDGCEFIMEVIEGSRDNFKKQSTKSSFEEYFERFSSSGDENYHSAKLFNTIEELPSEEEKQTTAKKSNLGLTRLKLNLKKSYNEGECSLFQDISTFRRQSSNLRKKRRPSKVSILKSKISKEQSSMGIREIEEGLSMTTRRISEIKKSIMQSKPRLFTSSEETSSKIFNFSYSRSTLSRQLGSSRTSNMNKLSKRRKKRSKDFLLKSFNSIRLRMEDKRDY